MFQIFTCLTTQHDWRLVVVAGIVCFLSSLTAITLFNRARSTRAYSRAIWIAAAGAAAGCGIWATHFLAMLAYEPGIPVAYDISLTILSLLAAATVTAAGLAVAVFVPPLGGAVRRRHHRRRRGLHALSRHVGDRDSRPRDLGHRPGHGLNRRRHGAGDGRAGRCRATARTARAMVVGAAAHPRHRLASFHRDGRGASRSRSHAHVTELSLSPTRSR